MKVLIVEDEQLAADFLQQMLSRTNFDIEIVGHCTSVKETIKWLLQNEHPELVFMDINLGDGICFEIFEVIDLKSPVIFTTAYDQYAIRAFKENSIDYLLKPVNVDDLNSALAKLESMLGQLPSVSARDIEMALTRDYKRRFVVKIGSHLKIIPVDDIAAFASRDRTTYAIANDGRSYPVDYSVEKLDGLLDPAIFFQVNRKFVIASSAIRDIITYSNSRLKVVLSVDAGDEVIVARERVSSFREWLDA